MLWEFAKDLGKGFGSAYAGLILRREIFELKEIIKKSFKYFKLAFKDASFNKSERVWTFKDGETLTFSQASSLEDYWKYHGQEFPFIGFDELTSWPSPELYEALLSCNRSSVEGIKPRIRATTNPWGAGHSWVKKRFIDPSPIGVPFKTDTGLYRVALDAPMSDNKYLLENNPQYIAQLKSISNPLKRKAWLDGDWNIQIGAFFGESFSQKNIIKPFSPPSHWLKWRSFDWGYAKPFSVGWFTISDGTPTSTGKIYPRGTIIRYKELYGCLSDEPNTGLKLSAKEIASLILEKDGNGKIDYSVADPAIFSENGAESIAEQFANSSIIFEKADNTRIAGWDFMRQKLLDSSFLITENCRDFIRIIPNLLYDAKKPEDLDTDAEDHIADECRYGLMTRAKPKINIPSQINAQVSIKNILKSKKDKRYLKDF